jgi:hypothetical protein
VLTDTGMNRWMSEAQNKAVIAGLMGDEWQFFADKMKELAGVIATMPKTYDQDGRGDEAVAHLHYFRGSADWYITEKDMEGHGTEQAFGLADLYGDGGELGYISIIELAEAGVELDFHFNPKTIGQIRGGASAAAEEQPQGTPAVVELSGKELGEFPDTPEGLKELRKAARAHLENRRGKWVKCLAMPKDAEGNVREVEIRQRGIDEFIRFSAKPEKLMLAAKVEEIIETARNAKAEPNFKPEEKPFVIGYYRLENRASIAGEAYEVTVLIEQDAEGYLHYDFILPDTKAKAALDSAASLSATAPPHEGGLATNGNHSATLDAASQDNKPTKRMVINLFIEGEEPEYVDIEDDTDTDKAALPPDTPPDIPELIAAGFRRVLNNDYVRAVSAGDKKLQFNVRVTDDGFIVRLTVGFSGGITGAAAEIGRTADAGAAVALVEAEAAKRGAGEGQTDPQKDADRALFQSVIDGTVPDILAPDLADSLEVAFNRNQGDPDMVNLFELAVGAYQNAMLAVTANLS